MSYNYTYFLFTISTRLLLGNRYLYIGKCLCVKMGLNCSLTTSAIVTLIYYRSFISLLVHTLCRTFNKTFALILYSEGNISPSYLPHLLSRTRTSRWCGQYIFPKSQREGFSENQNECPRKGKPKPHPFLTTI